MTGDRRQSSPGAGYESVYAAVDAYSRLAYVEVKANEQKKSAVSFLLSALRYYRRLGLRIRAVMTDNAPMFRSKKFGRLLKRLGIRHRLTPPYTPWVNGKVERFIRTLLNEWAYAHAYPSSTVRDAYLPEWLHFYNWHRPYTSLGNQAPISRLGLSVKNVFGLRIPMKSRTRSPNARGSERRPCQSTPWYDHARDRTPWGAYGDHRRINATERDTNALRNPLHDHPPGIPGSRIRPDSIWREGPS